MTLEKQARKNWTQHTKIQSAMTTTFSCFHLIGLISGRHSRLGLTWSGVQKLGRNLICFQHSGWPLPTLSLRFNGHSPGGSRYQNVFILDFVGAKDDGSGGDSWSYKSCKAPVKSSPPPTNQHPVFLQAGCPSCCPTNSVKALKGKTIND